MREIKLSVSKHDLTYRFFLQIKFTIMKKISRSIRHFAAAILILFFSGCYYDEALPETSDDDIVSYSLDIQPIFNNNCTSCHPVLVSPPDLSEGNSYNSINNGVYIIANDIDASLLYQRLIGNSGIMPPSGSLPVSEINLVKNWIEQGALNN